MGKKYPNLEAELARKNIKRKELAELLKVRPATIYDKLNGKYPFTVNEAMTIKNHFFPNLTVDYLFSQEPIVA